MDNEPQPGTKSYKQRWSPGRRDRCANSGCIIRLWVVGYDVGQIFSVVQGKPAYDNMWCHEFVHDIRHESGSPCH
jgi:hypothetical protein